MLDQAARFKRKQERYYQFPIAVLGKDYILDKSHQSSIAVQDHDTAE
jgi:hypothetical protein